MWLDMSSCHTSASGGQCGFDKDGEQLTQQCLSHLCSYFKKKLSVTGELTAVLQTWLNLPVECSVLPVCCMGVRVLCLPNGVGTAGTHSVQAVVVVCVRVHVLSGVRLLCRVEILRAVERALAAIEAHICGGRLRHGRGILGSRDGTTGHGDRGLLLLEDR